MKKIINNEIEKEIRQNDPTSIFQIQFHKHQQRAHDRMIHSIARSEKFDGKLRDPIISKLDDKNISLLREMKFSGENNIALPFLMMNSLFEQEVEEKDNPDMNHE